MKLIYFLAALGALATSCGPKTLDCQPRTVTVTGTLETDILGSWNEAEVDINVVATFHAGGRVTFVEASWTELVGATGSAQYSLLNSEVSIPGCWWNDCEGMASIDEHSLTFSHPDGSFPRTHPALTCHGKEF
jgi:hypothetical protein